MGEFLDQPAKLSPSLRGRKGNAGITPDNYQILSPSSNHIYTFPSLLLGFRQLSELLRNRVVITDRLSLHCRVILDRKLAASCLMPDKHNLIAIITIVDQQFGAVLFCSPF